MAETYTRTSWEGYSVHLPEPTVAKNPDALQALKNYAETKTREITEATAQSMFEGAEKHPMLGKSLALVFRVDTETIPPIDGLGELNIRHLSIELYENPKPSIMSLSSRYWADTGKPLIRYIEHDINLDHYFNRPKDAFWGTIPNFICLIGNEVTSFFRGEPVEL
jgi:hypothetical protein